MTDFWFGDIAVGLLTDKDTDISKEVVEKNFVDSPPQVYELTPDLESGTYSIICLQETHPRSEKLREQRDAVLSMPDKHPVDLPVEVGGDTGHVLVDQSNVSITPSEMIDEGEISIRFMDDKTYRPAYRLNPQSFNDSFNLGDSSYIALPDTVSNVSGDVALDYSIATEDGELDIYTYSSQTVLGFDRPSDFTSGERISPVRLYDERGDRVYSESKSISEGSEMDNGIIKSIYNSTSSSIEVYDSSWRSIGSVDFGISDGYAKKNGNIETSLEFISGSQSSLRRGFPVIRFDVLDTTSFSFNSDEDLTLQDDTSNAYRVASNVSGDDLVFIRTSTDGSFTVGTTLMEVTGLDSTKKYTFFFGYVPSSMTYSDLVGYVYNIGRQDRTLVQR